MTAWSYLLLVYVIIHVAVGYNYSLYFLSVDNKSKNVFSIPQNTQVHVILSFLWARGEQKTKVANGTPMNAMTGINNFVLSF